MLYQRMVKATGRPCDVTTGHTRVSRETNDYIYGSTVCLSVTSHQLTLIKWNRLPVDGTKEHVGSSGKVPLILTLILVYIKLEYIYIYIVYTTLSTICLQIFIYL